MNPFHIYVCVTFTLKYECQPNTYAYMLSPTLIDFFFLPKGRIFTVFFLPVICVSEKGSYSSLSSVLTFL